MSLRESDELRDKSRSGARAGIWCKLLRREEGLLRDKLPMWNDGETLLRREWSLLVLADAGRPTLRVDEV